MNLLDTLKRHEGRIISDTGFHRPYQDHLGHWTIGYGHLLSNGIPEAVAEQILQEDIKIAKYNLESVLPASILNQTRQDALTNMVFNMGLRRFKTFKKMIEAIRLGDWKQAKKEALDSLWHQQVKSRAEEIADMFDRDD